MSYRGYIKLNIMIDIQRFCCVAFSTMLWCERVAGIQQGYNIYTMSSDTHILIKPNIVVSLLALCGWLEEPSHSELRRGRAGSDELRMRRVPVLRSVVNKEKQKAA